MGDGADNDTGEADDGAFLVGDDPHDIAAARDWLEERLHRSWLLVDEVDELRLALTEALTNLLQHAGPRTKSELRVRVTDDRVDVLVADDSPPFDPGRAAPDSEAGYGNLLLNLLVDEVAADDGATGGSVLRLTKLRPER